METSIEKPTKKSKKNNIVPLILPDSKSVLPVNTKIEKRRRRLTKGI